MFFLSLLESYIIRNFCVYESKYFNSDSFLNGRNSNNTFLEYVSVSCVILVFGSVMFPSKVAVSENHIDKLLLAI